MLFRKLWTRIHSGWRKLLKVSKNLKSVFRYVCQSVSYCVHKGGGPMWPLPMMHWISSCRNRPHCTGTTSTELWSPSPIPSLQEPFLPPWPLFPWTCSNVFLIKHIRLMNRWLASYWNVFLFLHMFTDMGVQASWSSLGFGTENGVLSFQTCWIVFVRRWQKCPS